VRVSVFGDSVLLGAKGQLVAQLAPWPVAVDAEESRSLLGAIGILQRAQSTLGNVVVLDLGYNDGTDRTAFRERIDGAMAVLTAVPRVVWLNQTEFAAGRSGMNTELSAAAARYPNLDIVDWNATVVSHDDHDTRDRVHPVANFPIIGPTPCNGEGYARRHPHCQRALHRPDRRPGRKHRGHGGRARRLAPSLVEAARRQAQPGIGVQRSAVSRGVGTTTTGIEHRLTTRCAGPPSSASRTPL
jgi:hypothetical protein